MAGNKLEWIYFVALRYYRAGRKNRSISTAFFSTAGIAIGVLAMITIMGIMNGFQIGFIDDILEINSYHIRINGKSSEIDKTLMDDLKDINGIKSVLPFMDLQTLVKGRYSEFKACRIRSVPVNTPDLDPDLISYLHIQEGSFDLSEENSIILGSELAINLGVGVQDRVSLVSMSGNSFRSLSPVDSQFIVAGIFKSGYYEYDSSMGFVSMKSSMQLSTGKEPLVYGIKLNDRYKDREIISMLPGNEAVSWREYNRSFFGALRMEKISMMLIVGLIFVVVGVNIKHSLERSVYKRKQDIALLRSLGASPAAIKTIFVAEGVMIGVAGGTIGVLTGLLVSVNINGIFGFFGFVTEYLSEILSRILSPFINMLPVGFDIFSPSYFYLNKVPVKIIFHEVLYIYIFALSASIFAAYTASKKISDFNPSEILHYE